MDAIELLTRDHRDADELFERLSTADRDARRAELREELLHALTAHAAIEEGHFYPAFRESSVAALIESFHADHERVKEQLAELARLDPSDEEFDARLEALQRAVEAHVAEEERRLFPRVRELMNGELLRELGEELRQAKRALSEMDPLEFIEPENAPLP